MNAFHIGRFGVLALSLALASCGSATMREGSGTSFLIVEALEAASGAEPEEFGGFLHSDVITVVDDVPTVFNDLGRVRFALGLKDPGPTGATTPTQNQYITIDRYRVRYIRPDGRNTPGVDVPYPFDGAVTVTVGESAVEAAFQLVRHIAKEEAPLATLRTGTTIISTIAEITFYGRDLTGREVTATGKISVDFGNFGDPE